MPATSKAQQTAMRMALAARHGDLEVSKLKGAAKEIYHSDMSDKEIEEFTVLKEMKTLQSFLQESILNSTGTGEKYIIKRIGELIKEIFGKPSMQELNTFIYHKKSDIDIETIVDFLIKNNYVLEVGDSSIYDLVYIFSRKRNKKPSITIKRKNTRYEHNGERVFSITLDEELKNVSLW